MSVQEGTVSISQIREFLSCEQRYDYRYNQLLSPRIYQRALEFGSIGHKFLEEHYKALKAGTQLSIVETLEKIKIDRIAEEMDAFTLQKFETDLFMAYGMFQAYTNYYKADTEKWDILLAEDMLSLPEKINGLNFRGKPDLIVRERNSGFVWVIDHKFMSAVTEGLIKKLPMDHQVHAYIQMTRHWLNETNRKDWPIRGVIYNVVKKSQKRLKVKQTLPEFQKELHDTYLETPDEFFLRQHVIVTEHHVRHFDTFMKQVTSDMARRQDDKQYKRNIYACDNYGECPFLDLCLTGEVSMHLYKKTEKVEQK